MEGTYHLTGIMETASGLQLYSNGQFDFYYSYGAIDRHGYGTWEKVNDVVILQSDYAQKKGFDILEQKGNADDNIVVTMDSTDAFFAQYTRAAAVNESEAVEAICDKTGEMRFSINKAEKLMLMNELFPDNIVTIDMQLGKNSIRIKPNHDLMLVHFNPVKCIALPEGLVCPIPLLSMMYGERTFMYTRNQ